MKDKTTEPALKQTTTIKHTEETRAKTYDMLVFCHLRWGFVYQRPQHIISRLAKQYSILLIEEPIGFGENEKFTANIIEAGDNLTVLQPKVNSIEEIAEVLKTYVANATVPVGWFYSASFVPLIRSFEFEKIVYDCMDELSMFRGAPAQLIEQEKYLMSEADVVFTGGRSLFEAKSQHHENAYLFQSSVDQHHFEKALGNIQTPNDIPTGKPIVGYYGVIDERINLDMIKRAAEILPNVNFVLIGPLAKIGEHDLPRAENIFYPGMKTYDQLPAYLKTFDVAMMPFAMNDSTKFISPTKTPEYFAAQKPVVSTPVYDVVRAYGEFVAIVDDVDSFCTAIYAALHETEGQKKVRLSHYKKVLDATSWDKTVEQMDNIIKAI